MMREAVLQLQMDVPALKADASLTAVLKKDENVLLDLETAAHLAEASYQQRALVRLGNHHIICPADRFITVFLLYF